MDLSRCKIGQTGLAGAAITLANMPVHLQRTFNDHTLWITSNGKDGGRGVLIAEELAFVDLSKRNLSGMVLRECKLRGANLSGTMLAYTDLSGADLDGANLEGALLVGTNLKGARLTNANLAKVVVKSLPMLANAFGTRAHSVLTCLDGAILVNTSLDGIDLSQCTTAGAKFS